MLRGCLKALLTLALAGAVGVGFADAASADTGVSAAAAVVISVTHQQASPTVSDPVVQQAASVLKSGRTVDLQDQGRTVAVAQLTGGTLQVTTPSASKLPSTTPNAPTFSFCTYAVASALLAVGAVTIATIVAIGLIDGATEITIIGITLTPGAWSAIAGAMGGGARYSAPFPPTSAEPVPGSIHE